MSRFVGKVLFSLKQILLFISFGITAFTVIFMNNDLKKDMLTIISTLIPYLLLFVICIFNRLLKQQRIINNIFYNLTSCLVFIANIIIIFRAIYDKNMVLNMMGDGVNYIYLWYSLSFISLMLYGLVIANILFIISNKCKKTVAVKINNNTDIN